MDADPRGGGPEAPRSGRRVPRKVIVGALVLAIVAGAVAVVAAVRHEDDGPRQALVSTTVTNPRVNVFYGGSCENIDGEWFLNVQQGGGSEVVRVAFYLRWLFSDDQRSAEPGGRVTVEGGSGPAPTISLEDGVLTVDGNRSDGSPMTATGHLEVRLTGPEDAPTLTITEEGLDDLEDELGIVSPFRVDGEPVILPVAFGEEAAGDCPTA